MFDCSGHRSLDQQADDEALGCSARVNRLLEDLFHVNAEMQVVRLALLQGSSKAANAVALKSFVTILNSLQTFKRRTEASLEAGSAP